MLFGMCVGTIAFYRMLKSSDLDCVALPGLDLLTCPPGETEIALDAVAECWNSCKRCVKAILCFWLNTVF